MLTNSMVAIMRLTALLDFGVDRLLAAQVVQILLSPCCAVGILLPWYVTAAIASRDELPSPRTLISSEDRFLLTSTPC